MDELENNAIAPETQEEKPEWMSTEDWELVESLPVSARESAIVMRQKMKERLELEPLTQAQFIKDKVGEAAGPEQTHLATWCGYPTDMTRCSPFFPMSPKEIGNREYLENFLITSAGWGDILYTGPKLSTYDEDVLMVVLAVMNESSKHRIVVEENGSKTYCYKGPALPLLKLLGYDRPSKKDYVRFISSLERLTVSAVKISISTGKSRTGKLRSPRITQMSSILSSVFWDEENKELTVTVNPFFYETYFAGTVTLIDVARRGKLKGVIAKALYRFVQSHRRDLVFEGHFLTLADALNMDRDQPLKITRMRLKEAIYELIRHCILSKKSKFVSQDIIKLEREKSSLPLIKTNKKITK